MATEPYMTIPHRLFDELSEGKLTTKMYLVLCWLYRRADWMTGVTKQVSAKRIIAEVWAEDEEPPCERRVQEYLYRLTACAYIQSGHVPGKKGSYSVTINNFTALIIGEDNAVTYELLRPTISMDWRDLPKTRRGDKNASKRGEASGDTSGEASAYTNDSNDSNNSSCKQEKEEEVLNELGDWKPGTSSSSGTGKTPEASSSFEKEWNLLPVEKQTELTAKAERLVLEFRPFKPSYPALCREVVFVLAQYDVGGGAISLLHWNRSHKYKSPGLLIGSPARYLDLIKNSSLVEQYRNHLMLGQSDKCSDCNTYYSSPAFRFEAYETIAEMNEAERKLNLSPSGDLDSQARKAFAEVEELP
jgi:hypothetical protein